jgi:uncharacterized protein YndB with AHSA1/START domain
MKVEIQGDAIVAEIEIEAPPEVVFDALVTPEDLAAWWGADGVYRTGNWRSTYAPAAVGAAKRAAPLEP